MFSDKNFDKVEFLYLLTINYNATKTIWKFPFNQFLVPLLGLIIHCNLNATLLIIRSSIQINLNSIVLLQ